MYFVWFNWQYVSIGLGNGLAPNGWQVITGANADQGIEPLHNVRPDVARTLYLHDQIHIAIYVN